MKILIYLKGKKTPLVFFSEESSILEDYEHYKNLSKEDQKTWKIKTYFDSNSEEKVICDFKEVTSIKYETEYEPLFFVG